MTGLNLVFLPQLEGWNTHISWSCFLCVRLDSAKIYPYASEYCPGVLWTPDLNTFRQALDIRTTDRDSFPILLLDPTLFVYRNLLYLPGSCYSEGYDWSSNHLLLLPVFVATWFFHGVVGILWSICLRCMDRESWSWLEPISIRFISTCHQILDHTS